jgi:hypothetical protein
MIREKSKNRSKAWNTVMNPIAAHAIARARSLRSHHIRSMPFSIIFFTQPQLDCYIAIQNHL